jgi:HEAT repeat protein
MSSFLRVFVPAGALALFLCGGCGGGGGSATERAFQKVFADEAGQKAAIENLAKKGVEFVKPALKSKIANVRIGALEALALIKEGDEGREATKLLIEATKGADINDVGFAIISLGRQRAPEAKDLIVGFFNGPNPRLRLAACMAIGEYGDRSLYPLLDKAAYDENENVRQAASRVKQRFGIGGN